MLFGHEFGDDGDRVDLDHALPHPRNLKEVRVHSDDLVGKLGHASTHRPLASPLSFKPKAAVLEPIKQPALQSLGLEVLPRLA